MRVALAQINTVVGDLAGNRALVLHGIRRAADQGAELVVFPELALVGYPPRDLVERRDLARQAEASLEQLVASLAAMGEAPTVLVGSIDWPAPSPGRPDLPRNLALLIEGGRVRGVAKRLLPTYDVFDEVRHFRPGDPDQRATFNVGGVRIGVLVCEDQWTDSRLWRGGSPYSAEPSQELVHAGAQLLVNLSASPYSAGKLDLRAAFTTEDARRHGVGVALCNLVGGNDSLVFDGASMVVDGDGSVAGVGEAFKPDLLVADFDPDTRRFAVVDPVPRARAGTVAPGWPETRPCHVDVSDRTIDAMEEALVLGLRDYAGKLGFDRTVLGLSGGIDSALVAYLASRALGDGEAVLSVEMPSRYTSQLSRDLAGGLIRNLGMPSMELDVEPLQEAFAHKLAPAFGERGPDVTEENLQSRTRGVLLMALSNKLGHLLLSTGNKSEMAVGYCTLYGDMNGGLSVISDLFKLQVTRMCARINERAGEEVIPAGIISRPPSAELAADQKDEDSLPPYATLDPILVGMLVDRLDDETVARQVGVRLELVRRIRKLTNRSEFKRFQAAPTLRVSRKAWHGRRYPIVHRFR